MATSFDFFFFVLKEAFFNCCVFTVYQIKIIEKVPTSKQDAITEKCKSLKIVAFSPLTQSSPVQSRGILEIRHV